MEKISKILLVLLTIPLLPVALIFLFFTILINKISKKKLVEEEADHIEDDDFSACIKD